LFPFNMTKSSITSGLALLLLVMACASREARAQDPVFTQFPALPMLLNPAFTGYGEGTEITAIFRDQWPDAPQSYVTYAAAVHHYVPDLQSGFGFVALGDRQGDGVFNTNRFLASYAFQQPLGRNGSLRAGISFEGAQRSLAWDQLRFFDQIDPVYGFSDAAGLPNPTAQVAPGNSGLAWFDAHAGILIHSRTLYLGASYLHLPGPNTAFYDSNRDPIPRALSVQAGARLPFGRSKDLPSIFAPRMLYFRQGPFQQAQAAVRFGLGPVLVGGGFRYAFGNADAVIAEAGWRKGIFALAYSYDVAMGPAAGISGGAHEISVNWRLGQDSPRQRRQNLGKSLACPVF
jgi:type IX secretion system PorP/SprF family membrane protein